MASGDIVQRVADPIVWADHAGDFAPADSWSFGTPTNVQLAAASLANDAARQAAKADLGATFAPLYRLDAILEIAPTPTAGLYVACYLGWSPSGTAGSANPAGTSGSDGVYTGIASNLDASLKLLDHVGNAIVTADASPAVQEINVGFFVPRSRYANLVVVNRSGAAFHTDDVEIHFVATPLIPQSQA